MKRVKGGRLAELFERAEREKKWFYSAFQHLWCSPAELRTLQANGHLRGAQNWQLRDPEEYVAQLRAERDAKEMQAQAVIKRIRVGWEG